MPPIVPSVTDIPLPLVTAFRDNSARVLELVKQNGRTFLDGQGILDEPAWHWPSRRPVAGSGVQLRRQGDRVE